MFKFLVLLVVLAASPAFSGVRVGLVLDKGGRDDKSFNNAAYDGLTRAAKELGLDVKTVEATDDNSFEPMLRAFGRKKFDLIVAIGFAQKDAIQKIAPEFPEQKFVLVDSEVKAPNVSSLMFSEHEGSYLMGVIAALTSKSGKIGFVGGMDVPLIRRFEMGYIAGAKSINPKIAITSNFVGVTGSAWNNPPKAKELAVSQYNSGVDVIFTAAGASGVGVFDAAEESKKFVIGVDSNQNWIKPGFVLTSMMKRIDVALFNIGKDLKAGKFLAGIQHLGLKEEGVGYALDQYNEKVLSPEVRKRADATKEKIIAGKIAVPDYYLKNAKK